MNAAVPGGINVRGPLVRSVDLPAGRPRTLMPARGRRSLFLSPLILRNAVRAAVNPRDTDVVFAWFQNGFNGLCAIFKEILHQSGLNDCGASIKPVIKVAR